MRPITRALSVRQPYAELILRGEKTIEYRSRPTHILGERFYLYASKRPTPAGGIWSDDLSAPDAGDARLPWIAELARGLKLFGDGLALPRGLLVGTAVIDRVLPQGAGGLYGWHLTDVRRLEEPIAPERHPQPVWFEPFPRRAA